MCLRGGAALPSALALLPSTGLLLSSISSFVSAKVIQLKGAGETNLLQIEPWEGRTEREKGEEGGAGEDSFRQGRPLSWVGVLIVRIHRKAEGGGFLGPSPLEGWVEQSAPLSRPGKWWGCKWNPGEGNKRWGDCLVQPDSRVGAPLGHVNWSHLLPIPARSSCYHCPGEGGVGVVCN